MGDRFFRRTAQQVLSLFTTQHRGCFGNGVFGFDGQMTQYCIIEAECGFQLFNHFGSGFDVHQNVMGFMDFVNRVSQLAATPVFQTVNLTVCFGNHGFVTFNHSGYLLALIGMNDKHDLVMTHVISLWMVKTAFCHAKAEGKV
ncbi:hypothetical protein NM3173_2200 [Neisseria meningitidis NM3173]|nr:hypothetical protein NM3173_2200 [Neisseria meningitidis NM3173]